jgi:tRNA modification GTPase
MNTDTIVALATPPGVSALAVVRISGPKAIDVIRKLCPELSPEAEPGKPHLTRVIDPESGNQLDRSLVTVFRAPASYTGEDVVEISSHGGWLVPALVHDACETAGARQAEAGEFTRRAYLNGKMDLIQAEAVLDLIEGRSRAMHAAAVHQVERGLSSRIGELREAIVHLEALLMHHLDFPEEDDPPVPRETIIGEANALAEALEGLLRAAPEGELLREGAVTVLAGRPNSGKSSLFNALVGEERAIVTADPGTTRDALESVVSLGGFPFRLVDTAGLRESDGEVERLGIEVARRYLERANLVLFCSEAGGALSQEERIFLGELGETPVGLLRTKSDLVATPPDDGDGEWGELSLAFSVRASIVTGEGIEEIRELLPSLVFGGLVEGSSEVPILTRRRQTRRVRAAHGEIAEFVGALTDGVPAEVAATHLRPAETALEEVLGVISQEDVLTHLFEEFCIGK